MISSRLLVRLLLSAAMLASASACRSKHELPTPRARTTSTPRAPMADTPTPSAENGWVTLDVKLAGNDNRRLYKELKEWLGTPYRYAGNQKGVGTDCSGMVQEVYRIVFGVSLERNSAKMFENNCREIGRHRLREADLVFFSGKGDGRITHVGIYLKEGYFVHASSSRGVMVSNLDQKYWDTHFQCAGRVKR